jgi:hypothetical protein
MATQDKYDRQLRMWGPEGQRKLNRSHILCLGLTAAGTEALKNLVLPGVGHVHIVADAKVTQRDLARNFFIDVEQLGSPMAPVRGFHPERPQEPARVEPRRGRSGDGRRAGQVLPRTPSGAAAVLPHSL